MCIILNIVLGGIIPALSFWCGCGLGTLYKGPAHTIICLRVDLSTLYQLRQIYLCALVSFVYLLKLFN